MKRIQVVGVIGAGTMGSALAQKFAQEGFQVFLADREMRFVEKGLSSIRSTIAEGVERKIFSNEQAEKIISGISGTCDLTALNQCDIIFEAIFENLDAKKELFNSLNDKINSETIVATNTSSFSVKELADSITHPERFIGLHYFYHAAKNRLVEIIPGEKTSAETFNAVKNFSILSGKDAIVTKDRYGFAVNRFFVPWLNESVRLLEEKISDPSTIDAVCKKVFGISMGPFALMNATGVPIAYNAQKTLESFGEFYAVCNLLKEKADSGTLWDFREISYEEIAPEVAKEISDRMLGVVFYVCSQILEEEVCTATDLNKGAKIGLKWRNGPIDLMNKFGDAEIERLIKSLLKNYSTTSLPKINSTLWNLEFVQLEKVGRNAVVRINRPEDLNALNENVMKHLDEKFSEANDDENIDTIFITGNGKAFVAGADIKFFIQNIKNNSIDKIVSFTKYGHEVLNKIDKSKKQVIAGINGLALGGGLELALCADKIIATNKVTMSFPETGIGIYPGLGGTQRSATRMNKGLAKYLIFTGKMISADDAFDLGLIDAVVSTENLLDMLEGNVSVEKVLKTQNEKQKNYRNVEEFFNQNSVSQFLDESYSKINLTQDEAIALVKAIKRKAPIALRLAEQLIDDAKGTDSELEKLPYIFSTSDALLGLSSIGKKVTYEGK